MSCSAIPIQMSPSRRRSWPSDVLYRDGCDIVARPLRDRRARLEDIVAGGEPVFRCGRSRPDGLEAWAQLIERGYESLVAKDEASAYTGGPTRRWFKVKQKGWTIAEDGWRRRISALNLLAEGGSPAVESRRRRPP